MAKVTEMVRLTLMPMSSAASLSSDTARMALPVRDLEMNSVRIIMIAPVTATVRSTEYFTLTEPRARAELPTLMGNSVSLLPKSSFATSCRR